MRRALARLRKALARSLILNYVSGLSADLLAEVFDAVDYNIRSEAVD